MTTAADLRALTAAAGDLAAARHARDDLIVRLRAQGVSLSTVAAAAALSRAGVAKIAARSAR